MNDEKREERTRQRFRLRAIKYAIRTIEQWKKTITLKNVYELTEVQGIGKGIIEKIIEILKTGTLKELKEKIQLSKEDIAIDKLTQVIDLGLTRAKKFVEMGIYSIQDLKKAIKEGKVQVNNKILLGLKYYSKIKRNIPRSEMKKIEKLLKKHSKMLDDKTVTVDVVGSYRRKLPYSNDIDVLLTTKKYKSYFLKDFVQHLTDVGFLLPESFTPKNVTTKFMGMCRYNKNTPIRRIDIRYVSSSSYPFALLYFTGSKEFNRWMRREAKKQGYKLSEWSLETEKGKKIRVSSEKEIFDILGLTYIKPEHRSI